MAQGGNLGDLRGPECPCSTASPVVVPAGGEKGAGTSREDVFGVARGPLLGASPLFPCPGVLWRLIACLRSASFDPSRDRQGAVSPAPNGRFLTGAALKLSRGDRAAIEHIVVAVALLHRSRSCRRKGSGSRRRSTHRQHKGSSPAAARPALPPPAALLYFFPAMRMTYRESGCSSYRRIRQRYICVMSSQAGILDRVRDRIGGPTFHIAESPI